MKKRILSTIIAILLIIPTFLLTGCKKEENVVILAGSDATPMTITLYSVVEGDSVDESVRSAIEAAINEITEFEFNTHIILKLFTEEEYHAQLYADLEEAAANQTTIVGATSQSEETQELELATDENGETKYVEVRKKDVEYPAENGTQVDIFLINSIDQYNRHVTNYELKDLTAQLLTGTDYAILNKYINTTLMNATKLANDVDNKYIYAIPNNRVIGEYEYMLVSKDMIAASGIEFNAEEFDPTLANLETLLVETGLIAEPIAKDLTFELTTEQPVLDENGNPVLDENGNPKTTTVDADDPAPTETAVVSNDKYTFVYDNYGVEPLYESLGGYFGGYYGDGTELKTDESTKIEPGNLLDSGRNPGFAEDKAVISKYFSDELVEGTEAACMFVKGPSTLREVYEEDYYVFTYKAPIANNDTVFNSMYGVCGYSDDARTARCMEIITYMQTNQEFANIFRYGVEGVHYEKDENDLVTVLNDDYRMKPEYAGNMFLHYQNTDMTDWERKFSADDWFLAKEQNRVETYLSPYLGFSARTSEILRWTIETYQDESKIFGEHTSEDIMNFIESKSTEYDAVFENYIGSELIAAMAKYGTLLGKEDITDIALNVNDKYSPKMRYNEWYNVNYPQETAEA